MEPDAFKSLLARFAQRPVPPLAGRHVYLWYGELPALHALMPSGLSVHLDLWDLARSLPRTPLAVDEARRVLQAAIQPWLEDHAPQAGVQRVVLVTGATLLARYHVPLNAFFNWAGEAQMFVFVLPPHETAFRPQRPLPPYVDFNSRATLDYLQTKLGDQATIGAGMQ
jgi:hypothetical protein